MTGPLAIALFYKSLVILTKLRCCSRNAELFRWKETCRRHVSLDRLALLLRLEKNDFDKKS